MNSKKRMQGKLFLSFIYRTRRIITKYVVLCVSFKLNKRKYHVQLRGVALRVNRIGVYCIG